MAHASWPERIQVWLNPERNKRFLRYLFHRFGEDRCMDHAAALSYTTLLSLVPLMAVTFSIVAAFPVFDRFNDQIQDFVFSNFVPTSGAQVQEYLQGFTSKASKLTAVGIAVLVLTALMMMATIDKAFNRIWRTRKKRSPLASFMVYWAVLSLGPVFIGVSLAVTSYLVSIPLLSETADSIGVTSILLRLAPFMLATFAFSMLYLVVPNRRVSFRHALAGGALAALLFETAKRGFAFYVTTFPTYEAIYGTLATIPVFLIWTFVSWVIALLGAEFTQCLDSFRDHVEAGKPRRGEVLVASVRVLGQLWQAQRKGDVMTVNQILKLEPRVTSEVLDEVLDILEQAHFIHMTANSAWSLSRDLKEIKVSELYAIGHYSLPTEAMPSQDEWDTRMNGILQEIQTGVNDSMGMSLDALYRQQEGQV